ncbi:hypothetical protein [Geomicrobium sp. JCM 19037]|uniref:hypothetical protein n=1 Tax=Geomicrobium sp. JCM 19037 TaxID=1460634 RepID=UPI0005A8A805|nr:hypothetical protein [Geomicrobium sp. JCM 19037]
MEIAKELAKIFKDLAIGIGALGLLYIRLKSQRRKPKSKQKRKKPHARSERATGKTLGEGLRPSPSILS